MPRNLKKKPHIPNSLVTTLSGAPEEIIRELIQDSIAMEDPELKLALVEWFCLKVEWGESPSFILQNHIARFLDLAMKKNPPKNLIGKSTLCGRRDFWLSLTAWRLMADGRRIMDAFRITEKRWNNKFPHSRDNHVSTKIVSRAFRRFEWLNSFRPNLPELTITGTNWQGIDTPLMDQIVFGGSCMVRVPTACITEVPGIGESPSRLLKNSPKQPPYFLRPRPEFILTSWAS